MARRALVLAVVLAPLAIGLASAVAVVDAQAQSRDPTASAGEDPCAAAAAGDPKTGRIVHASLCGGSCDDLTGGCFFGDCQCRSGTCVPRTLTAPGTGQEPAR